MSDRQPPAFDDRELADGAIRRAVRAARSAPPQRDPARDESPRKTFVQRIALPLAIVALVVSIISLVLTLSDSLVSP